MQLKRPSTLPITPLQCGLAAAAATLVAGATTGDAQELDHNADASLLVYSEPNRVTLVEGMTVIERTLPRDQILRLQLAFDALTGASANGATPATQPQTFTSPSGGTGYTVGARQTPLDNTFHDTRGAASVTWSRPLDRLSRLTLGAEGSAELDYKSVGVNAGLSHDFNRRNTTLSAGGSYSSDHVQPIGTTPTAFMAMAPPSGGSGEFEDDLGSGSRSSESKNVLDGLVGVTQVLGRSTLGRVNFSVSRSSGYLTDPYKVVTVVASPTSATAGDPVEYLYESRPDARIKRSVYAELRHGFESDTVDLSYRYLWDDWGIHSHTVEGRYRWRIGDGERYLQPHLRWYRQTGAGFFRSFLVDGEALPDHASADYRLGPMDAWTMGMTLGVPLPTQGVLRVTMEYYRQIAKPGGPEAFGSLQGLDLHPDVSAIMLRVGFTHEW